MLFLLGCISYRLVFLVGFVSGCGRVCVCACVHVCGFLLLQIRLGCENKHIANRTLESKMDRNTEDGARKRKSQNKSMLEIIWFLANIKKDSATKTLSSVQSTTSIHHHRYKYVSAPHKHIWRSYIIQYALKHTQITPRILSIRFVHNQTKIKCLPLGKIGAREKGISQTIGTHVNFWRNTSIVGIMYVDIDLREQQQYTSRSQPASQPKKRLNSK